MGEQNTPAAPIEPDLTADEARALVDELVHDGQAQAIRLRALRNRKGYTALGYLNWQVCCEELIGISVRAADYQIDRLDTWRALTAKAGDVVPFEALSVRRATALRQPEVMTETVKALGRGTEFGAAVAVAIQKAKTPTPKADPDPEPPQLPEPETEKVDEPAGQKLNRQRVAETADAILTAADTLKDASLDDLAGLGRARLMAVQKRINEALRVVR